MYKQSLSPKPLPWYASVGLVLAIVASLWCLLFLHNLWFYLFTGELTRAALDVVLLLIAGAVAYTLFVSRCTAWEYSLEGTTLTLQAIRGHRTVKQMSFSLSSATLAPLSPLNKKTIRFCYKGHPDALVISSGDQAAVFAPNAVLLQALDQK